ncbi:MAG TPA: FtsX-like permease family protein [Puia sp.]|nr:FtsX-like permease family protein [Puia sp.]
MFKNYFKTALRNLAKNKVFSLINVAGLSIGISSALVIYLIVSYDFSFDKFEKDRDRIYRIVSDFKFSGEDYHNSGATYPLAAAIKKDLTAIENVTHFCTASDDVKISVPLAGKKDPAIFKKQKNIVFADDSYFNLVSYNWIAGSKKTALQKNYESVLTESNAKIYFPNLKPSEIIGKEIIFDDTVRTSVVGIVKDLDENSDFTFKTFISLATYETRLISPDDKNEWGNTNSAWQLLVKLAPGNTAQKVTKQVNVLREKYKKPDPNDHSTSAFSMQPLSDVHFNTTYNSFGQRTAHKPTMYGLLAVAAFLLLLGCINFINLTTAQASQRAKEIGIRKTMGSSKKQLIFQFLSETFLLTIFATLLSILITPLLLKMFSDFIPKDLHFTFQPGIVLFLIGLIIVVGLLSGFYPALVLSSYKPVLVLKNQTASGSGNTRNIWMRKTLTVSQFVIAQVFIIGTILVTKQISYWLNKDLGFKKDAIVYLKTNYYDTFQSHRFVLMEKLRAIPEISMISLANDPPSINSVWSSTMKFKDGKKEIETDVQVKLADTNYLKLFRIKLLAGSNLPYTDTTRTVIINEAYANVLGFKNPNQAIGKLIEWDNKSIPICGVVSNFHQRSLHEPIKPLIFTTKTKQMRAINIALMPQNAEGTLWKTALGKIEKAWKETYPEDDFSYTFLDDTIKQYYTAEQNISKLLMWATGLAIFISCLGLLGLVTYITNQRTKEIGVRKVIGASVTQIISLLSKDFLKLVLIAFVIAIPIAWWGGHKWLESFSYKTNISIWMFALGGCIMFAMALLILCLRTFKAATVNPVKSLRSE